MEPVTNLLDRLLDPVGKALTAEVARRFVALRADAEVQQRIDYLADRNTAGALTSAEKEEYEALVAAGDVIAILQSKAPALLVSGSAA